MLKDPKENNSGALNGVLDRLHFFVFLAVGMLARWPMWQQDRMLLNGDECVLALMGKHLSEGKGASVFFYGQKYFLSIIETLFTGAGFAIAGVSDLTYRIAVLVLMTIGLSFFYRFLKVYLQGKVSAGYIWGLALCMALAPAWMRLLYTTPFTLTFILLFVLATHRNRIGYALLVGVLIVLIDQAHRLWTLPVLLISFAFTYGQWTKKQWLACIGALIIGVIFFEWYRIGLHDVWHPNFLDFEGIGYQKLRRLPAQVFVNLSGHFYLSDSYPIPYLVKACVVIFSIITLLGLWKGVSRKEEPDRNLRWALVLCLLGIPFYVAIARLLPFRYMMPLSQLAFVLIGVVLWKFGRRTSHGLIILLLLSSITSVYAFKDFKFYSVPKQAVVEAVSELKKQGVKSVFCTEPLAQWQIDFYSNEEVTCRYFGSSDRYPPYVIAANTYLEENGSTTLVGRKWKIPDLEPDYVCADGELAIYYGVDRAQLEKLEFRFGDPWADAD